ncbi:replication initiation protein [Aureispira anguillae]|uniref:Replication initiation protein n=1 Tax=Aureispira anguillae TaxID=2864201 RepID=A0A916DXB1_9BACT|nr:replication initiation protein [Aureispira anguillae]BDS15580.1 replication initiation protein [Aureispira anguillae]
MNEQPPKALVTKSNNLVEARYHFSIWETRVFTKLVSLIQPGDEDFKKYKLQIRDLVSFFGVNDNDAYAKIKAVPDNLLKKVVTIPYTENGEERFLKTGLIAQASIPKKKEGYIELSFHPDLKPYLLQLKRTFLSYDIRNVLKISSVYSIRIYELLKQYEKIGYREFDIDTLKVILGVSDKYKLYGHFKSRIILKAQEDLKLNTDICFNFTEIKRGRKVIAILFEIRTNKNIEIAEKSKEPKTKSQLQLGIEEHLLAWGVSQTSLKSYIKNYSLDYLKERIQYILNQQELKAKRGEKIENLAAYFNFLVGKKDVVDYVEQEKKAKKTRTINAKNTAKQKKVLKDEIVQLKRDLEAKEQAFIHALFDDDLSFKTKVMEQVRTNSPLFYADRSKSNEDYFKDNPLFRAAVFTIVKQLNKKEFATIRKAFTPQIKALEQQLRAL